MSNSYSIARHFTRGAAEYHQRARVQRQAAEQLAAEVRHLELSPQRVLDIGCGTGFLIREIANLYPAAEIVGIDLSPGMVEFASREVSELENVNCLVADGMQYVAEKPFDLVVSSSTMQWLRPFDHLMATIKQQLAPKGWFCISAMIEGTLLELHTLRRELFPNKPVGQRIPTKDELQGVLVDSGFEVVRFLSSDYEVHSESARGLFDMIRSLGFTGGPLSQGRLTLTRGEIEQLANEYDARFRDHSGQVKASYRCGNFLARSLGTG